MSPVPVPDVITDIAAIKRRKTPLEHLYEVMCNKRIEWGVRVRAMVAAAEYVHAKQPQAIHVTGEVRIEAVTIVVEGGIPELPVPHGPDGRFLPADSPP